MLAPSRHAAWLLVALVLVACAGPQGSRASSQGGDAPPRTGAKRIVAAIQGDPHTVYQKLNPASRVRGIDAIQELVAAGLIAPTNTAGSIPQLAQDVPSTENGLWRVFPDGHMETTWKIRPNAKWHDGVPFTSEDVVFTLDVVRDPELPIFNSPYYDPIEAVDTPDPSTVTIRWAQPFIEADLMLSSRYAMPIPKHILAQPYAAEKAAFTDHPYWSTQFVGAGAYKLKSWAASSHMILAANDDYALGRPKIDEIEIRFIPDANTLMANILAGGVELTLGRSLSGEQAVQVRDQWPQGHMELSPDNWIALYPQFLNPSPAILADVQMRKALMHATNRQAMVDAFLPGLSSVADSWLAPGQPEYQEMEQREIVRYEYDPQRAGRMIEALGYAKGSDGMYRDRSGAPLSFELRTTVGDDLREKMLYAIADNWQRDGVGVDLNLIPRQLAADLEYRATFPAFELVRNPNDVRGTRSLQSRYIALPENGFRVTGNRSRYSNPELDALVDRYFQTIPRQERDETMGHIIHIISDQLVIMGMVYNTSPTLVANRILNVTGGNEGATQAWNVHQWDTK